ncbi:MAG: RHS repeat-associated core domain-containing protein [Capsulimonadaceae bacterium]|nr:RHS repeat-associated core domain-containing protein [Capsulimonadaceae bacterium]
MTANTAPISLTESGSTRPTSSVASPIPIQRRESLRADCRAPLATGTLADPFAGFGGQYMGYADSESGLTLFGERYYDSGTGRWLNRDPIGYAGGINVYAYCGNDPAPGTDMGAARSGRANK